MVSVSCFRKFRASSSRYRLLSRSQRPDDSGQSLMEDGDDVLDVDDDDDPILDPGLPGDSENRLELNDDVAT